MSLLSWEEFFDDIERSSSTLIGSGSFGYSTMVLGGIRIIFITFISVFYLNPKRTLHVSVNSLSSIFDSLFMLILMLCSIFRFLILGIVLIKVMRNFRLRFHIVFIVKWQLTIDGSWWYLRLIRWFHCDIGWWWWWWHNWDMLENICLFVLIWF